MWLNCSNRCGGLLFRALEAELDVNEAGNYQGHRLGIGFICLQCGSPALDLGQLPQVMAEDAEEELAPEPDARLCPHCETMVSVFPGEGCPNCDANLDS
ncbi:MAG: hypothetical protein ACREN8_05825 [Candidatus Dormibacteraceae bacterium]